MSDFSVRKCAGELLATLNNQPRINKERLFSDAMAYYRWQISDELAPEALGCYTHEFLAHHKPLVDHLPLEIWQACFITWFVESRLHELPPLLGFDPTDELMQRTRFTSPSFRLPTGEPMETYLVPWVFWHLDNLPVSDTGTHQYEQWIYGLRDEVFLFDEGE